MCTQNIDHVRHGMKMAIYKPRTGTSEEANLDDTLILNLRPPKV